VEEEWWNKSLNLDENVFTTISQGHIFLCLHTIIIHESETGKVCEGNWSPATSLNYNADLLLHAVRTVLFLKL